MTDPLAGVRAIVTGGASGMGAGIVGAYAAHGAQVVSLGLALVVSVGAYLAACKVLHVRELQTLFALGAVFRRG